MGQGRVIRWMYGLMDESHSCVTDSERMYKYDGDGVNPDKDGKHESER